MWVLSNCLNIFKGKKLGNLDWSFFKGSNIRIKQNMIWCEKILGIIKLQTGKSGPMSDYIFFTLSMDP